MLKRILVFAYGTTVYLFFFATLLYTIGFVGNWFVPKGIDDGQPVSIWTAVLFNVPFLLLFGVQHTIMARPAFKRWWTQYIPEAAERSTFVLATTLIVAAMMWQWKPAPDVVWSVENPVGMVALMSICGIGWGIMLSSSFLIDHFDLFGLRQVYFYLRGWEYHHPKFVKRAFYKHIRHPLMLGFLLAFWSTPVMTQGHLLFAVVTTGYILFGTWIEERDLVKHIGQDYREYQRTTPKFLPIPRMGKGKPTIPQPEEV